MSVHGCWSRLSLCGPVTVLSQWAAHELHRAAQGRLVLLSPLAGRPIGQSSLQAADVWPKPDKLRFIQPNCSNAPLHILSDSNGVATVGKVINCENAVKQTFVFLFFFIIPTS